MKDRPHDLDGSPPRIILCAIADDDHLQDVVATGRALARTGRFRALFAHVAAPAVRLRSAPASAGAAGSGVRGAPPPISGIEDLREDARQSGLDLLREAGIDEDESILAVGTPASELNRLAAEHDAALIVAGSDRRGELATTLTGSVSRELARDGACSVLFARSSVLPGAGGPIVCGIDITGEQPLRPAVCGAQLALLLDDSLVLAHVLTGRRLARAAAEPVTLPVVFKPGARQRDLARCVLEAVPGLPQGSVENVVLDGSSVAADLDRFAAARHADLLVVGCRGAGLVQRALEGSVSAELLRNGRRPLVIVPPG